MGQMLHDLPQRHQTLRMRLTRRPRVGRALGARAQLGFLRNLRQLAFISLLQAIPRDKELRTSEDR
jgi:hypothetical protein